MGPSLGQTTASSLQPRLQMAGSYSGTAGEALTVGVQRSALRCLVVRGGSPALSCALPDSPCFGNNMRFSGTSLQACMITCCGVANRETDEPEWRPVFTLELKAGAGGMLPAARLSFMAAAKGAAALSAVAVSSLDGELVWASYACSDVRSHHAAHQSWRCKISLWCKCLLLAGQKRTLRLLGSGHAAGLDLCRCAGNM